jgi:hypothetical protein
LRDKIAVTKDAAMLKLERMMQESEVSSPNAAP